MLFIIFHTEGKKAKSYHCGSSCSMDTGFFTSMDFLTANPLCATILAALIFMAIIIISFHGRKKAEKRKKYHPIAATRLNQLINFNSLHDYMTQLSNKHSTFRVLGLFRSEVYTSDPANVEYILKTNFSNYGKVCTQNPMIVNLGKGFTE